MADSIPSESSARTPVRSQVLPGTVDHLRATIQRIQRLFPKGWKTSSGAQINTHEERQVVRLSSGDSFHSWQDKDITPATRGSWSIRVTGKDAVAALEAYEMVGKAAMHIDFIDGSDPDGAWWLERTPIGPNLLEFAKFLADEHLRVAIGALASRQENLPIQNTFGQAALNGIDSPIVYELDTSYWSGRPFISIDGVVVNWLRSKHLDFRECDRTSGGVTYRFVVLVSNESAPRLAVMIGLSLLDRGANRVDATWQICDSPKTNENEAIARIWVDVLEHLKESLDFAVENRLPNPAKTRSLQGWVKDDQGQVELATPSDHNTPGTALWLRIPKIKRDQEIIRLALDGKSNREIADAVGYQEGSVANRISTLAKRHKIALPNRRLNR